MEIIATQNCCMALEAAEVIARHVNGEDYQETKNKILMRYGARFNDESRKKFTERLDVIAEVYQSVESKIVDSPEMEFLFRKHYYNNTYSILAQVMLLNFHDIHKYTVADYLESCMRRWKKTMKSQVHLEAVAFSALVLRPGEKLWKDCLLDDIDKLDYPYEFKWGLLKVLTNFEFYIEKLGEILGTIEEELRESLKKLDPIVEEMQNFWKKKLTEATIEEMAESMNLLPEDVLGKKVMLQLLRMPCDQAIMDDQWSEKQLPVYLGLGIEWGSQFEDEQIDRSLLCEELRVLSEDSKFEILRLLKNEGSYGQEIARKVKLDAATVSRHLTVLQRHGLVYIEKKEGRNIYYRVNQNEIRNLLELMQNIFLS
ncbi:MAG: ArsR/SmtB family transcription factor [Roseburia sp.]